MRRKGAWSEDSYRSSESEAKTAGSSTFKGEQRAREGKGLDPLVDPSQKGVVRGSNTLLVPKDDQFVAEFGVAMPVESDLDTTGSMGGNVEVAFRVLPKVQNLLVQGKSAVLRRYHTQIATGVIQDEGDQFAYERSMFEPDNEVERQMGLLVPNRGGGDAPEEYQLGLFAAGYLTKASITRYGLRGYYFVVGDMMGRDKLKKSLLERVFGPTVLELAFGGKVPQSLPGTKEVAKKVLEDWHAFFLQVNSESATTEWWTEMLGRERVIRLPRTEDIAEVQAVLIGLTEGVLDLQTAQDFLRENGESKERAVQIIEAVRRIPIGLQTTFENFGRIPAPGAVFANREDLWPVGVTGPEEKKAAEAEEPVGAGAGKPGPKGSKKKNWKI